MASKGTESRDGTLNIVLLGKSGVGKSSCGNTILGKEAFKTRRSSEPVTLASEMCSGHNRGKRLLVVDTPDLFGSQFTHDKLQREIANIKFLSSSGPCVYLLMLTLSELGADLDEMLFSILDNFGEKAMDLTMALLPLREVDEETVRMIIHHANESLPMALRNKFHVLCMDDQLGSILLGEIETLLNQNNSFCGMSNEIPIAKPRRMRLEQITREERGEERKEQCAREKCEVEVEKMGAGEREQQAFHAQLHKSTPRGQFLEENTREERGEEREDQHARYKPKGEDNRKEKMSVGQREEQIFIAQFNSLQISNEIPVASPKGRLSAEGTRDERRKEREDQHARSKEIGAGQREKQAFNAHLNRWRQQEKKLQEEKVDCLRLVLIGKTGAGKSATGNTILGKPDFKSSSLMVSVTTKCKKKKRMVHGRMVQVIDTPGLFDTTRTNEDIKEEIGKCIAMSTPGPHVFLLLIAVGRFTQEETETVKMIQEIFGKYANTYTMVGFTRGEELRDEGTDMREFLQKSPDFLRSLMADCGNRYHVFCNKDKDTRGQVISLFDKIDKMIRRNGGSFYTTAMFEETDAKIRAREMRMLQEKLEELVQAKEKKVSYIFSELTKIKQLWKRKSRALAGMPLGEQDEDMIWFEDLLTNLEKNQDMNISEIDGKILEELIDARDGIRKDAEKAEAKAVAKKIKINEKCTIS